MNRTFEMLAGAALIVGLGALTSVALARDGDRGAFIDRMFETMDANKDGAIDADEAAAAQAARFSTADADGDGGLTLDEMKAAMSEHSKRWSDRRAERRFSRLDADGDGKVTEVEMSAMRGDMFSRVDADGDGRVTRAEAEAMKSRHGRHRGGDRAKAAPSGANTEN